MKKGERLLSIQANLQDLFSGLWEDDENEVLEESKMTPGEGTENEAD